MPEPIRITLETAHFEALARGESIVIRHPVALILTPAIGPFRMLGAMVAGLEKGPRLRGPVDPPEAREFLPVKRRK